MKSIGIDITVNGATIVEVSTDRGGYEVIKGDYIPLNPVDTSNWEIDLAQGLKRFSEEFDMTNTVVVTGLPQTSVSTRNFNFPFNRRLDIQKTLVFELDEELPMGAEDLYGDAKITAQSPGSTSVLAFAAPKEEVHQHIERLQRAGIDPDIISAEGSAFANLFEDWNTGSFLLSPPETVPSPMQMRVFFRHESTLISLFQGRQLVWTRSLSWGEKNVIMALMKAYNYPYQQAADLIPDQTRLLMMKAGGDPSEVRLTEILEHCFAEFVKSLSLSIIDVQDKFQASIGDVILMGSMSRIENLNAYITKTLGITCNVEDFMASAFQPRQIQSVLHFGDRAVMAVGLAIEGLKKPRNPAINLRLGEAAKQNAFWERTWEKWGYAMALACIAFVTYTVYGYFRAQLAVELDTNTYTALQSSASTIAGIRGSQATPEKIEEYINNEKDKQEKIKLFDKVQDIEPAMKVVNAISAQLPSNKEQPYDIRKVDVKNSEVRIEGEALQAATVDQIKRKLESLSANKKVRTLQPSFGPSKGVPFAFGITVKETL